MTTLVGIKAEMGKKGVVFGSDLSSTIISWESRGDTAYKQQTKQDSQKIYVNNSGTAALGMAGINDDLYKRFLSDFTEDKFNLKRIIKNKYFKELLDLNLGRWGGRKPDNEKSNGLLMATRIGEPRLYTCWSLGMIEERPWTSIGSGSDYAIDHIKKQPKIIPEKISISDGIDMAIEALDRASQDIYTGGLDLVIITSEKIDDFGKDIRERADKAKKEGIEHIKSHFKGK